MEGTDKVIKEIKSNFSLLSQIITSHMDSIKQLDIQLVHILAQLSLRKNGGLPSDTVVN